MRDKLHRVRSTDLDVLRSMLIEETHTDEKEASCDDCNENGNSFIRVDKKIVDAIVPIPRASVKTAISRTPVRPFLITRIGSKHQWRPCADSLRRDSAGDESEQRPMRMDLLATANRLWDQSLSEARRVFQDSLASHRLTSGCPGDLIMTDAAVIPPELSEIATTARIARTEHRLVGNDPETVHWLQQKERERRRERRLQARQSLADSVDRHEAHLRHEQRQEAARQAFEHWFKNKKIESTAFVKETAADAGGVSSDCSEEAGPVQAGRQPRPSRKAYFRQIRCVLRPKSAVSFAMDRSTSKRMKVEGHRIIPHELQVATPPCPQLSLSRPGRLSGDFSIRPTLRLQSVSPLSRRPPSVMTSTEGIGESLTRELTNGKREIRDSIKGERVVAKRRDKKSRRKSRKHAVANMADELEREGDPLGVDDDGRSAAGGRQSRAATHAVEADGELSSLSERFEALNDDATDDDGPWDKCSINSEAHSEK